MERILEKYNWPTKSFSNDLNFNEIESIIGFKLPSDYKLFLSKYSGNEIHIGEEYINLWDFEKLVTLNRDYQIIQNLKTTIGIGDNGSGEFIGIEKQENELIRIILSPFIDLDKKYHIEIGNSFTDFLIRMDKGEKWFKK